MSGTKDFETVVLLRYMDEAMRATKSSTPTELARKARIAPSTLTRMLKEGGPTHSPRPETLRQIERVSRVPLPPELANIAHPDLVGAPAATAEGELNIPVRALVGTRIDGRYLLNREPFEWTRRLPGLARRLRVFAVRMPDDTMAPWRQPNEMVFVDPTWAIADGCHVVVYFPNTMESDGEEMVSIRRFRGRDRQAGMIRLEDYTLRGNVTELPTTKVLMMHRVVEWTEAAGI